MVDREHIICGLHDPIINLRDAGKEKPVRKRISSINPKNMEPIDFKLVSTNGDLVYDGARSCKPRDFFAERSGKSEVIMVLTIKEYRLLNKIINDYDVELQAFEIAFPIFDGIEYRSDLRGTFIHLKSLLRKVERMGIRSKNVNNYFSVKNQFKVERALRTKSNLDKFFYFCDPSGFQEVFKLQETRKNRCIIAMDFNSMFLDCMRGDFACPKRLRFVDIEQQWEGRELKSGIYHVILEGPNSALSKHYHPFRKTFSNSSYRFDLEGNDSLEVILFDHEILEYGRYFDKVKLKSGIVSDGEIKHPLIKGAQRLYQKRKSFKRQGAKEYEKLAKIELQMMHSATSIKKTSPDFS